MNKYIVALIAAMSFILGIVVSCETPAKRAYEAKNQELLEASGNYYHKVEKLLDMYALTDTTFYNTWAETDIYCEYVDAKTRVDSIAESY